MISGPEENHIHALLDLAECPMGSVEERVKALVEDYRRVLTLLEARSKKTPREKLLEMLDEDRFDVVRMLADACLDEGLDEESKGWAYVAAQRKWPKPEKGRWVWHWRFTGDDQSNLEPHELPGDLYRAAFGSPFSPGNTGSRSFKTARVALQAAVGAIAGGKWKP